MAIGVTVNVKPLEVAVPFDAVTLPLPGLTMSAARIEAVTFVALTKAVVRALPFHFTTTPVAKPVPFTVRVKATPPAVAVAGDKDVSTGATTGATTVKVRGPDVMPPLFTVTG